jgi:hypothetical protein
MATAPYFFTYFCREPQVVGLNSVG